MISINSQNQQQIITESIPWRNGQINFSIGRASLNNLTMDCFILNDLDWVMKLNPSFMVCFPVDQNSETPFSTIIDNGSSTNAIIIVSKQAQNMGYSKSDSGTCLAKTYFFGRRAPDRTFDLYFRLFERGFSISQIEGVKLFSSDSQFDITTSKEDYSKSSVFTGNRIVTKPIFGRKGKILFSGNDIYQIPARVRHVL